MALKPKDTYRIECAGGLSEDSIQSLMMLYQPLVGGDAMLVYLTLFSESKTQKSQSFHSRLLSLMNNIPCDVFEKARIRLEEYKLLRTYEKESQGRNSYVYVLNAPLNADHFLQINAYMGRYREVMGRTETDATVTRFESGNLSLSGYKDITVPVKHLKSYDNDYTVTYTKVKPKYNFSDDEAIDIHFDYEKFIASTSTLVFPAELRTTENMALIGRMATVYGLSVDTVRKIVMRCVNMEDVTFHSDRFRILCAKAKPEAVITDDPYALPPVSFLQAKQNGAMVTMTDKKMLSRLSEEMHFSNEVINILIEYVLASSDNRLSGTYVDKVAGQWARDGVKTKEDALKEVKKASSSHSMKRHIKVETPSYLKDADNAGKTETSHLSEEEKEAIRRLQKEMSR